MIVGKLSKHWAAQSTSSFSTLPATRATRFLPRQFHSRRDPLYRIPAESITKQGSKPVGPHSRRYSSQQANHDIKTEEDSTGLYGSRYASRESPSWKKKSLPQRSLSNSQGESRTSAEQVLGSQEGFPKEQSVARSQKNTPDGVSTQTVRRDSHGEIGNGNLIRKMAISKSPSWGKTDPPAEPHIVRAQARRADDPSPPRPLIRRSFTKLNPDIQGAASAFRRIDFQKGHVETIKSESRQSRTISGSLVTGGTVQSNPTNRTGLEQESSPDTRKGRAEDIPRWNNLPRKTENRTITPATMEDDGVVRFQPFESAKPKPSTPDSFLKRSASKLRFAETQQHDVPDDRHTRTPSNEYVGFQENIPPREARAQESTTENSIGKATLVKPDVLATEPDLGHKLKGRRRNFLLEEEDIGKSKKSSKAKYSRSSKSQIMDEDEDLDPEKLDRIEAKQRRKAERKATRDERASGQVFVVPSFISIGNLASSLKIRADAFSEVLKSQGFSDLSNDHIVDAETAGLIASELGFKAVLPAKLSKTDLVAEPPPKDTDLLPPRPPIVTIMGHVDHGKTTLLDWLRNSSVAASEHGGITQHIGAFTVQMPSGRIITFLDTPGHAAFLEMRARGANVTDIVILVVAADDSVKPQTIEAIKHAKAAKTQVVVAISKIDKHEADADRVKQDLARNGIEVEDYGGDTQAVCVSGKTGQGMDQLEDAIIALADILDVKADTTGNVEGWVLEAARKASGKIATVLVRRGTLRPGQIIVAGHTWARVRNLRNEAGVIIDEALPGTPVEIDGWDQQPEAGAEVLQAPNEQKARRVVDYRRGQAQIEQQMNDVAVVNEARKAHDEKRIKEKARAAAIAAGEEVPEEEVTQNGPGLTEVPLILRADVSGSIEAVNASVLSLGNTEIRCTVIRSAVGNISESDIEHAAAVKGHIVNFNLPVDGEITGLAEQSGVKIVDGNIIYRITDDVKALLEEYLPPVITHHVTGEADILKTFEIGLKGKKTLNVAGCKVRNGTILKGSKAKVIRRERVVYEGVLSTLKNLKKDVTEMRKGTECGLSFDDFQDFNVGDQVQCYETKSQKRRL